LLERRFARVPPPSFSFPPILGHMTSVDALKKPTSAYWMWLNDNRDSIARSVGSGRGSLVAKRAGELWKALPDADKQPYEEKAKKQKEAYNQLISTEEGRRALDEKKAAQAGARASKQQKDGRKNDRATSIALKQVVKDDALKKPRSAYWIWLGENRDKIASSLGKSKVSDVAKKGGELWKALSEAEKAPYQQRAKEEKDAHDAFLSSAEGKFALQAYKDAQQAAREQVRPQMVPHPALAHESGLTVDRKRAVDALGAADSGAMGSRNTRARGSS